ncbi:MAG: superoxide dismutase family protein [Sphingomonas sp.]
MNRMAWIGALAVPLALAGCNDQHGEIGQPLAQRGRTAIAVLHNAAGTEIGRATASEVQGGLRITLEAHDLPAGPHGAHVHAVGRCDPPGFESAGGHWNPLAAHHGSLNPAGPHMGDLPNLDVATNGRATLGVNIPGATIDGLLDADGSAMVIHAGRDDMMSDPSGNSGSRIACGVFQPG